MKLVFVTVAVTISLSVIAGVVLSSNQLMLANAVTLRQTGALLGYGGQVFGLIDASTDDHKTRINVVSDFLPPSGKVFEVWMVDANYRASGYPLSLGEISANGTLSYNENLVFSPTYTDVVVTLEPENDKDPKPNWSQSVAGYWLAPPFGQ